MVQMIDNRGRNIFVEEKDIESFREDGFNILYSEKDAIEQIS